MIKELTGKKRLFTPVRLINSIVRWILGVYSPSGTIKVRNTTLPNEGRSLALDVDMAAVKQQTAEYIGRLTFTKVQRNDIRDVLRTSLDRISVDWGGAGVMVRLTWLQERIEEILEELGYGPLAKTEPAPKAVLFHVANETGASKAARVGTSKFAARADHEHRLPPLNFAAVDHKHESSEIKHGQTAGGADLHVSEALNGVVQYNESTSSFEPKPPAALSMWPAEGIGGASQTGYTSNGRDAGSYDFSLSASSRSYVTIMVASRVNHSGAVDTIFFRPFTIAPDGRIARIGPESTYVAAVADASNVS